MLAEEHYAEHRGKVFFPPLIEYIMGRAHYPDEPHGQRVIAIVYQGPDAVQKMRDLAGPTNPHTAREQKPGCIRSLGTIVTAERRGRRGHWPAHGQPDPRLGHARRSRTRDQAVVQAQRHPAVHAHLRRRQSDGHFYFRDDKVTTSYRAGSICLLAPGDTVWTSDLEALHRIA